MLATFEDTSNGIRVSVGAWATMQLFPSRSQRSKPTTGGGGVPVFSLAGSLNALS
jgi:hypothetical protein